MYNIDDVINGRLSQVKEVNTRTPWIAEGFHESLIVLSIETYTDKKLVEAAAGYEQAGLSVRAMFEVEKSMVHAAGSLVTKTWALFKQPKYADKPSDADKWVDFVCQMQGIKIGQHQASMQALIKPRAQGGQMEAQIARGVRISATGTAVGKPNEKTGQRYVEVAWQTYTQQDGNRVAQTRAELDQRRPYTPTGLQPAQQQQAPAQYTPPQQQFQQPVYNGTPMQNLPQAPVQYTQVAPQQYQVQPQQYQVQPQPAQQGYVQQPAQPPQGVPAGGFLSLLPPTGK